MFQNVCTTLLQEIDLFCDKMVGTIDLFKNVLIQKSALLQLCEKISAVLNPAEDVNLSNSYIPQEQVTDITLNKRGRS